MQQITTLEGFDRDVTVHLKQIHADPLIKMKKYDGCTTGVGASLDRNGYPVTGLTEDYKDASGGVVKGTRIAMEKLLDLPEGTLKQTSPYWNSYFVRVSSDAIPLDLRNNHELLQYLYCIGQSNVANGVKDMGKDSGVEFLIYSEEQEAAQRVAGRQSLKKAYILSDKLDLDSKCQILAVYGDIVDSTNANTINDKVEERLEQDPGKFLKIAGDSLLVIRSLLSNALDKGILTKEDGAFYHGDIVVGHTEDMAVEAIAKDKTLQTILQAKLSGDMELISKALSASKSTKSEELFSAPVKDTKK